MKLVGHERVAVTERYFDAHGKRPWDDILMSEQWLLERIQKSDLDAHYALATLLGLGFLGRQRRSDAFDHAERAAESGAPHALMLLANLSDDESPRSLKVMSLTERAAELGYGHALWSLSIQLDLGRHVARDADRARYYMRLAADAGFSPAEFDVGSELVTHEDPSIQASGLDYIRAAANKGYEGALLFMSEVYDQGKFGVAIDPAIASIFRIRHEEVIVPYAWQAAALEFLS